ncbi:hypothetical protein BU15DRAFT_80791 [Melanogaster broomeanus]|nr:hypothetical protein BU15DRAFT_80791 [Melanogaster broomeanus]
MYNPYGYYSNPNQCPSTPYHPGSPFAASPYPFFSIHPAEHGRQLSTADDHLPTIPSTPRRSHNILSPVASPSPKRKRASDENQVQLGLEGSVPKSKKPKSRTYTPRRPPDIKLAVVFEALTQVDWSLGQLLYHLFRLQDEKGDNVHRSPKHAAYVHQLLNGSSGHGIGFLLDAWMHSPDGVVGIGTDDHNLMYNTSVDFKTIRPVRPALTSFAAQIIKKKLVQEAEEAVKPGNGLHTSVPRASASSTRFTSGRSSQLQWTDIGLTTVSSVADIIKKCQPLTWDYVTTICARPPRKRNGVVAVRKTRPVEAVAASVISEMDCSRDGLARRLPMTKGMFYFAFGVPHDVFAYNCRVASTVSYGAVYRCLQELSEQEAKAVVEVGRDLSQGGVIVLDNVQNYLIQRDARIGRTNKMNVGIAAMYIELEGMPSSAFNLEDKLERLKNSKRCDLTVEQLIRYIDQPHIDDVMSLHWLLTLSNYIPCLDYVKKHVLLLFRTRNAKLPLPVKPSKIHPLATSSKNETVTTELKDALFDFLAQTGQTKEDFQQRLTLLCGDGLTYEKIGQLKKYLQFHDSNFLSLNVGEATLAPWHTQWTDISRLYENCWGETLSTDPSSIAHSVAKIGRAAPPNLKKSTSIHTQTSPISCLILYFKQDDLFTYFANLAMTNSLPCFEDLEVIARKLHRAYTNTRAIHFALRDVERESDWASTVPLGTSWNNVASASSLSSPGVQATSVSPRKVFKGDYVLARSMAFMRDALVAREAAYATAEGDPGRLYEMMKIMLFTFASSSHSKYVTYLLETIVTLELESSPELRQATLQSMLVNLSGRMGSFCALDFMQEYFNRLLEAIVQRKGVEYGAVYIRTVIARNLHHFGRIKKEFCSGVGLQPRSGHHKAPHTRPEVRLLLEEYHKVELHSRRVGRRMADDDDGKGIDSFGKGVEHLRSKRLATWIKETSTTRSLLRRSSVTPQDIPVQPLHTPDDDDPEDNTVEGSELSSLAMPVMGNMILEDGQLIIDLDIEHFDLGDTSTDATQVDLDEEE